MRNLMRKKKNTALLISLVIVSMLMAASSADRALLTEAKIKVLDKQWKEGISLLDSFIKKYPTSRYLDQAYFYKGKCHTELKDYRKSIEAYENFVRISKNESLLEQANVSIINNAYALHEKGNDKYLKKIYSFLSNRNKPILRYYSALKLSYSENSKIAAKSVPVLLEILEHEKDEELRDRAKIAILRVDPSKLNRIEKYEKISTKTIIIEVFDKKVRKVTSRISIPLALADIGLKALSEEHREFLRNNEYDIADILNKLSNSKEEIISFDTADNLIKVWIEE